MNLSYLNIGGTGKFTKINFENTNIIIGSLFSEIELLGLKNIIITDETNSKTNFTSNVFSYNFISFVNDMVSNDFEKAFEDIDVVIFTNIDEILSWPFILRKMNNKFLKKKFNKVNNSDIKEILEVNNVLKKIKFVTTEPITQISRTLLCDFYDYFNKIMNENVMDYPYFVNSIYINEFLDCIINLNYNCEFKLEDHLQIVLGSSGYNLGSSNVLFKFYNKKIIYLSKSAFFDYRYPKAFEFFEEIKESDKLRISDDNKNKIINLDFYSNILEPDVLICADNILKFEEEFIPEFEKIINILNSIMQQYDRENNHFPSIFFPNDPLFILDFIDIKRLKISNDIRCIYLSKVIKSILEYANVSHGFINNIYHNKIYDFKLPFNYEEMMKSDSFAYYSDFEEFIKSINRSETETSYSFPKILMLNLYMLLSNGLGSELYDFFKINSSIFDGFFNINKNSIEFKELERPQQNVNVQNLASNNNKKNNKENSESSDIPVKFRYLPFNFDFRMNILNFSEIIFNKWKPKIVYFSKNILENKYFLNQSQKEKNEKDKACFANWLKENFNIKDLNEIRTEGSTSNKENKLITSTDTLDGSMKLDFMIDVQASNSRIFPNKNNDLIFESKRCNLNQETKKIEFMSGTNIILLKLLNPNFINKEENNEMDIDKIDESFKEDKIEKIHFDNLTLDNAYLIDKKENIYDKLTRDLITNNNNIHRTKGEKNTFEETVMKVNLAKENEKFYFQPILDKNEDSKIHQKFKTDKEKEEKCSFDIEIFKNYLKEYLQINNMKIKDIIIENELFKINIIREDVIFSVGNKDTEINGDHNSHSTIIIKKKDNNEYDLEVISDNIDDSYFLNNFLNGN